MKILVVDDNQSVRESIYSLLTSVGYEVELAANGLAAFELAQNNVFSLHIIDHLMPVMNGLQLCKNLRCTDKCKNIPILFMTTQGLEKAKGLAEHTLFDGIIEKPIKPEQLLTLISKLVNKIEHNKVG